MAWRETRGAWRHVLYFFICIALGVGAVVGIDLFATQLESTVTREARALQGGDIEIRSSYPLSEHGRSVLAPFRGRGVVTTHATELVAMAAASARSKEGDPGARATQVVELKAVEATYPLYGSIRIEPDQPFWSLLAPPSQSCTSALSVTPYTTCYGAVVQEALLIRMGLAVGDPLKIGQARFLITGVVRKEPDRMAGAFSLGPRVFVSQEGLAAAELVKPGSRLRERYLLRLPPTLPVVPLLYELRGRLSQDSVRITSYQDAQPQLRQFLAQLARYLGLIGLTALFLGGIGVGSSLHAFLREKLQTIAVLKTLGADSRTIVRTYLVQALALGLVGSTAGAAFGIGLHFALPPLLGQILGPEMVHQLEISAKFSPAAALPVAKGIGLGLASTLLFALWPLLGIRHVEPALILRREVQPGSVPLGSEAPGRLSRLCRSWLPDRIRAVSVVGVAVGLAGLGVWQAGSWRIGLLYLGGLGVAVVALFVSAIALVRLLTLSAAILPGARSLAVRQAISNIRRPGSQATAVLVSIGIGVMVILTVSLLEQALLDQVGGSRPTDAPTFFFIDIQPDQKDAFMHLLAVRTGDPKADAVPLVRSRLHAVNGRRVNAEERLGRGSEAPNEERRKNWYVTREYVLTMLPHLPKDNRIVKGTWWGEEPASPRPLLSLEEEAAKNLGVNVGSTITLEIQGATVSAEVASIRKVEWGNFSTNFYMILSPGSLDGAPLTYVATVRVPVQDELPLQEAVVSAFPNVTAINIRDVLDSFSRIVDRLSLAIQAVALFCVATGAVVMAAALSAGRYRRLYESVIFKAIGATRAVLVRAFALEYALLGFVGGLVGAGLASALSWWILRYSFDLDWALRPMVLTAGVAVTMLLSLAVGFLSTFRILGERPLSVLRRD
jgi:putative ABC transport system permease protein